MQPSRFNANQYRIILPHGHRVSGQQSSNDSLHSMRITETLEDQKLRFSNDWWRFSEESKIPGQNSLPPIPVFNFFCFLGVGGVVGGAKRIPGIPLIFFLT